MVIIKTSHANIDIFGQIIHNTNMQKLFLYVELKGKEWSDFVAVTLINSGKSTASTDMLTQLRGIVGTSESSVTKLSARTSAVGAGGVQQGIHHEHTS